jgi:hypothetical protein
MLICRFVAADQAQYAVGQNIHLGSPGTMPGR